MTDIELHEYALKLSENTLERVFDAEAYICKCIAETKLEMANSSSKGKNLKDIVPESNIDEQIEEMNTYFAKYMEEKSDDRWEKLLNHIHQILSELYHTTSSGVQKESFISFVAGLGKIW